MTLYGYSTIAGRTVVGAAGSMRAMNPRTGEFLEPEFGLVGTSEVDAAAQAATAAFDTYRATPPQERADLLRRIADELDARRDEIVQRAGEETGLPAGRLNGEHARTAGQLRKFADELLLGAHQEVRIDHAMPDRIPTPRPDIRQRQIPLGPVAVFGASNFPLAFSTAGGDTASALAAGCPVIVKAHNSHPGTAELVGQAVTAAVAASKLPGGVFSQLFGPGQDIGQALAAHPAVKAIAFTGSRAGGTALMRTASQRAEPIPVYAEMSSINPVVLLPGVLSDDLDRLVDGFVGSLTLGAGQFCTNPGLVFVPTAWAEKVSQATDARIAASVGQTMLSKHIYDAYNAGINRVERSGAKRIATGAPGPTSNAPAPAVFRTPVAHLLATPDLQNEVFGSAALFVTYDGTAELTAALERLEGQLTVSIHARPDDHDTVREILPILERKAGRLLYNGWPTGVEVTDAMTHGGPYPATSDSRTTSVGTLAITRFQRPVSYQGFPEALLPEPVQDPNPWHLPRRIDGRIALP